MPEIGVYIAAGLLVEQTIKIFEICDKSQKLLSANFEAQRDFLKRLGSNFRLYNSTLLVSYTSVFKISM
jgi:hypothetical protein